MWVAQDKQDFSFKIADTCNIDDATTFTMGSKN